MLRRIAADAAPALELSDWTAFKWGVVGALMALLAVQGLPIAAKLARHELDWEPNLSGTLGVLAFTSFFLGLGGGVAVLVGEATDPKHAVFYGLGWQGILGGYIKGTGTRLAVPDTPGAGP